MIDTRYINKSVRRIPEAYLLKQRREEIDTLSHTKTLCF